MNCFLEETKPAVTDLIALLGRERRRLEDQLRGQKQMSDEAKRLFEFGKQDRFTAELWVDLDGFDTAAKRFGSEAEETRRLLDTLKATYEVIAGAILQIGKQGLSLAYGPLTNCPPGRAVGSQPLSTVIWQARNQAMHYDEPPYRNPVIACFGSLEADFGTQFRLGPYSLAARVVGLLRWDEYATYEADMASLLPP
ncbi:MAG: hypothetical protein JWO38_3005 [Gemmataceae bacterium]|nr:hypothetical protein [Gemmataceae bacterium]